MATTIERAKRIGTTSTGKPVDLDCPACRGKGYVADPDGGAPEPCYCGYSREEGDRRNAERLAILEECHREMRYARGR